jgi:hypothetical protein
MAGRLQYKGSICAQTSCQFMLRILHNSPMCNRPPQHPQRPAGVLGQGSGTGGRLQTRHRAAPARPFYPARPCRHRRLVKHCELGFDEYAILEHFLSCLCGSEPYVRSTTEVCTFLSCLCGSEPKNTRRHSSWCFLSCLCGSERFHRLFDGLFFFLSCLCGSERLGQAISVASSFLSCLCGSELTAHEAALAYWASHLLIAT